VSFVYIVQKEYPDYYEIIKRPMDMQKIIQRIISNQYRSIEEMVSDVALMFDNACKYNEPDSLIYKVWYMNNVNNNNDK